MLRASRAMLWEACGHVALGWACNARNQIRDCHPLELSPLPALGKGTKRTWGPVLWRRGGVQAVGPVRVSESLPLGPLGLSPKGTWVHGPSSGMLVGAIVMRVMTYKRKFKHRAKRVHFLYYVLGVELKRKSPRPLGSLSKKGAFSDGWQKIFMFCFVLGLYWVVLRAHSWHGILGSILGMFRIDPGLPPVEQGLHPGRRVSRESCFCQCTHP